jgi:UDP-glucuronate 4-epimerase
MTVFVTGVAGFIGLAVTEALLARGARVVGFDLVPIPAHAEKTFAGLPGKFEQVEGDVCDAASLKAAIRRSDASCLLSLAAVTAGVAREISDPVSVVRVNVSGAATAIEAAAACGIQRIVHLSSGSVYSASGRVVSLLSEDTPLRPEQLYGISKQAGEAVALRLSDLHRLDLSVGRLGICFGRWEYATGARDTPSAPYQIVQAFRSGRPAILPRSHLRDWLYARDAVATGFIIWRPASCGRSPISAPGCNKSALPSNGVSSNRAKRPTSIFTRPTIAPRWRTIACEATRPSSRATILPKRLPIIWTGLARDSIAWNHPHDRP